MLFLGSNPPLVALYAKQQQQVHLIPSDAVVLPECAVALNHRPAALGCDGRIQPTGEANVALHLGRGERRVQSLRRRFVRQQEEDQGGGQGAEGGKGGAAVMTTLLVRCLCLRCYLDNLHGVSSFRVPHGSSLAF